MINGTSDKLLKLSAKIYPNPVSSTLNIQLEEQMPATIKITDLTGREVRSEVLLIGNSRLDVSTLPAGIYLIQLKTTKGTTMQKVVKQ
jgi:hypothetical protein